MTLVRVNSGEKPGDKTIITDAQFKDICTFKKGDVSFVRYEEALHWLSVGRIGSHWQIGMDMYIKVLDEKDDIEKYYTPPKKERRTVSTSWSCKDKGCCGSGDCGTEGSGCSGCP